jgi:hypothetical protein
MIDRVTRSKERVNAAASLLDKLAAASPFGGGQDACRPRQTVRPRSESVLWRRSLSSLNGIAKLPCFSRHARAAARS